MPIYSYVCQSCEKTFDEFFFRHAQKQATMPCECGGKGLATATVAHIAGRHTNKDSVRVPGGNVSMTVDGFKKVETPRSEMKKIKKGKRRLKMKREPKRLKTVREL